MDFKLKTRIRVVLVAVALASATAFTTIAVQPAEAAAQSAETAAQPAQALDYPDCLALLEFWGYDITLGRVGACIAGETSVFRCINYLYADGIRYDRAEGACLAAAN